MILCIYSVLWCRDNHTDPCKQLLSGGGRMILCIYCGAGTTILIPVNSSYLVEAECSCVSTVLWCRDNNTDPCKQLLSGGGIMNDPKYRIYYGAGTPILIPVYSFRIILCIYCGAGTPILIPVSSFRIILCIYCGAGTTILIPVNNSDLLEPG